LSKSIYLTIINNVIDTISIYIVETVREKSKTKRLRIADTLTSRAESSLDHQVTSVRWWRGLVTAWRRAAGSINAVLILHPCSIRWSFRKVVGTWPDPRSLPWADAFSSYVLRFLLSVIRSINDIRRLFDTAIQVLNFSTDFFLIRCNRFFFIAFIF